LEVTSPALLEDNVQTDLQGPPLLLSEFEAALKEIKNGKTEGIDGIPALDCTVRFFVLLNNPYAAYARCYVGPASQ